MAKQTGNASQDESPSGGQMGDWQGAEALRWRAELLERMLDAAVVWQLDGAIVYWNHAAEQLYGYSRRQAAGRNCHELLQTHHPLSVRYFRDILARTGQWTGELRNRAADGRQIPVESCMVLLHSADGPTHVLETSREVTHYQQVQEQMQSENQGLEQRVADLASQARSLAAQLSQVQQQERCLLARQLNDQLQQQLVGGDGKAAGWSGDSPDGNLYQFLRRVDDLLDQSDDPQRSLAAQLRPPILYHGNMSQILQWLAHWMQDKHGLAVQLNTDEQANPRSQDSRVSLFAAVRELLFNVCRHAGTGKATVTLVPGPGHVRIAVADDGVGFDPDEVQARDNAASGGLSRIRRCLGRVGGWMEIQSAPGEGTIVMLQAPVHVSDEARQVAAVRPAPQVEETVPEIPAGVPRIRVLLADDHAVVRDGLRRLLQMQPDIEVIAQAADGLEAVDLALQLRPDVIVLDANMPRLNGIQAARRIVANLPEVRIIGLSMYTATDMDVAMRQAGACEYLTKTSSPENVVTAVRTCAVGRPAR